MVEAGEQRKLSERSDCLSGRTGQQVVFGSSSGRDPSQAAAGSLRTRPNSASRWLTLILVVGSASAQLRADTHYVDINSSHPVSPYTNGSTGSTWSQRQMARKGDLRERDKPDSAALVSSCFVVEGG
jgi:hypothetical protein